MITNLREGFRLRRIAKPPAERKALGIKLDCETLIRAFPTLEQPFFIAPRSLPGLDPVLTPPVASIIGQSSLTKTTLYPRSSEALHLAPSTDLHSWKNRYLRIEDSTQSMPSSYQVIHMSLRSQFQDVRQGSKDSKVAKYNNQKLPVMEPG